MNPTGAGEETGASWISFGKSSNTGPGRPWDATAKALRTSSGTSLALRICPFHFVTGRESPSASASWKASVPIRRVATWPLMQTTGTESDIASSRPVMVLLTPGPEVTSTTPGFPVARA